MGLVDFVLAEKVRPLVKYIGFK